MGAVSRLAKDVLQRHLMPGAFLWRLPGGTDCALTFDDGPHPLHTPQILELLGRHQIKASFFLVGEYALRAPELVRRIAQEGHCVASHTFSHRELPTLSRAELDRELMACRQVLQQLTGCDTRLIRPPRGRLDARSLLLLRRWGYRLVHWSKTYSDYLQDGPAALVARIGKLGLEPRDIALFHDNNPHTVAALTEVLPRWQTAGRSFVSLQ
ncbi:MAG TPA: polysaccharide deacetylase family protein [Steroidobacteraceae bacterium]|jgi:peptidoglycan/xylan/chitin deacetylase (PgdA/CDA1 family)